MKKKESEFLTEEEAHAMLRVPDRRTLQGKRDYAILLTLLTTGLRKAGQCAFEVRSAHPDISMNSPYAPSWCNPLLVSKSPIPEFLAVWDLGPPFFPPVAGSL